MIKATDLTIKYDHYNRIGHGVFAVTLSTYVKSFPTGRRPPAKKTDDRWRMFWDHHFIYSVKRCLPFKAKIDHDWALEESPDGYFHYHGLLTVDGAHKHCLWKPNGLNKKLSRRLSTFSETGNYRPFRVNAYLIEPINSIPAWTNYSSKQSAFFLNTNVLP